MAGAGQGEDVGEAQHRDDDEQSLDTGTNQRRGPGSRDQLSTNHSSPRRRGRVRLVPVGVAVHARAAARQHRQLVQRPVQTQVLQQSIFLNNIFIGVQQYLQVPFTF